MKKLRLLIALILSLLVICAFGLIFKSKHTSQPPEEDKAAKIAIWIQEKVNTGGYKGCETRVITPGNPGLIQCDLHFSAGTDSYTVRVNTKGIAETFAQVGRLASTIYYSGYSGAQKVCEYQYDCYSGTVKEKL